MIDNALAATAHKLKANLAEQDLLRAQVQLDDAKAALKHQEDTQEILMDKVLGLNERYSKALRPEDLAFNMPVEMPVEMLLDRLSLVIEEVARQHRNLFPNPMEWVMWLKRRSEMIRKALNG